jgi:hypothetical protein
MVDEEDYVDSVCGLSGGYVSILGRKGDYWNLVVSG